MVQQEKPSVLRRWLLRPLPVALAHKLASARMEDPSSEALRRIYTTLSASEQALCQVELARCGSFAAELLELRD